MARIELHRVGLTFHLRSRARPTLKDHFVRTLTRRPGEKGVRIEALRDVNLEAGDGDRVAVLGHNGAGKSTLLKLLAGVYPPTAGRRRVEGRISSLFDIALGFEPEVSGRENIYIRGYLQGETPASIRQKAGPIGEFSELGDFLDLPIRCYSSGMLVRLAFAIATAVEPEVLLIDEVLSVGDLGFQQKARQKMQEMMRRARLMVVVSHDLESLTAMCNRAIWMEQGGVRREGPVDEVVREYRLAVTGSAAPPASAA
jgi:ABC-type polysaccharide/polyol phosphate transport system ATPase subunit